MTLIELLNSSPCDEVAKQAATKDGRELLEASMKQKSTLIVLLAALILAGSVVTSSASLPHSVSTPATEQKSKEKNKGNDASGAAENEREVGRRYLRRGEAGEALVHLENALRLYKGSDKFGEAATHDLLGNLYERQGRYGLALEHYQSALRIYTEPKIKDAEYNANLMLAKIGNMYYQQGNLAAARDAYGRMKVKKPGSKAKGLLGALGGVAVGQSSDNKGVEIGAPTVGSALS